jgi:hypothetical protein
VGGCERHVHGGIDGLYRLLRGEGGAALEVDLQRVYGVDIRTLLFPVTQWRRLGVLVAGMYGDTERWGPTEHLLAAAVDTLRGANWQRSGGKGSRPKPTPRPGRKHGTRRYGTGRHSIEHMQKILDRANQEVTDGD